MNGKYINADCMEYLKTYKDNHFDLAIVDPPYGIGMGNFNGRNLKIKTSDWDKHRPEIDYFNQVRRVSRNCIIWGGNYFADILPVSSGWIFWDKKQTGTQQRGEMAWTSFKRIKYYLREWYLDRNWQTKRIHPTQKPVTLYRWLLQNYAKPNDLILDTHVGSASSLIACEMEGFKYHAFEKDPDYYKESLKRLKNHLSQKVLF